MDVGKLIFGCVRSMEKYKTRNNKQNSGIVNIIRIYSSLNISSAPVLFIG